MTADILLWMLLAVAWICVTYLMIMAKTADAKCKATKEVMDLLVEYMHAADKVIVNTKKNEDGIITVESFSFIRIPSEGGEDNA